MTPSTVPRVSHPGSSRPRTFGVAPYVPGRTTKEYIADGTLRAVDADDEVAALEAYAAAHGLTVTGDPLGAVGGKRICVALSDGREYVSRYLKTAVAELLPPELILDAPAAPSPTPAQGATPSPAEGTWPAPAGDAAAEPASSPPEPPEFPPLGPVGPTDLDRIRSTLQPLSWSVAAALWGAAGEGPQPVQVVTERFAVSPGFVRMVAASVVRLASDDDPTAP